MESDMIFFYKVVCWRLKWHFFQSLHTAALLQKEAGQNLEEYWTITNVVLCNLSETLMAMIYLLAEKPIRKELIFIN